jgi:anthranilate/para-aminobenzoate synthase component I
MARWVEPFAAALALREEPGLVLLESMPGFGHLGRRSFLAARPSHVASEGLANLERRAGGWRAGWLSYDLGREIEALPATARDDQRLPPLALGSYPAFLEFDHARGEVHLRGDGDAAVLVHALERARGTRAPVHRPLRRWTSSLSRPAYELAVRRAVDYIRAGDVFQVNLAQRLSAPWRGDPFALYGRLRETSPSPFMALLRLGGADVISASPERFVRRRGARI